MAHEISEEMEQAVRSLSPDHLVVLTMMEQDHSYEHISQTLDCPLGTVRSRVYRVRIQLRRNLKECLPSIETIQP